jgi:hypothetical protein
LAVDDLDTLISELREAVAGLPWRFAKSMPEIPHWYIVRSAENNEVFARLLNAIKHYGYVQRFGKVNYRYIELGDGYKYWAISNIMNRDQKLRGQAV